MPPGIWASLLEAEIRDINLYNKHKQAYGPINATKKTINNDSTKHAASTTDSTRKKQPNKFIRTSKPTTTTSKITATATTSATNEYRHTLNKLAAPDISYGHGYGLAAPERSYTPSDYEVPYYMSSGQILPADDQAAIDNLIQAMSLSLERETKFKTTKVVSNVEAGDRFGGAKVKAKERSNETFKPLFAKSCWEEQVLDSQVLAAAALAAAAGEEAAAEQAAVGRVVDRAELAAELLREWDRQQAEEEITDTYEMVAKPSDSDSDATNSKNGKTNTKKTKEKKYQLAESEDDVMGAQIMIDHDELVVVETISSADVAAGFEMVERVGGGEEGGKRVVGQGVKEGKGGQSKVAEPQVKEKLEAFPEFDDDFANEMFDHPEEFYGYY